MPCETHCCALSNVCRYGARPEGARVCPPWYFIHSAGVPDPATTRPFCNTHRVAATCSACLPSIMHRKLNSAFRLRAHIPHIAHTTKQQPPGNHSFTAYLLCIPGYDRSGVRILTMQTLNHRHGRGVVRCLAVFTKFVPFLTSSMRRHINAHASTFASFLPSWMCRWFAIATNQLYFQPTSWVRCAPGGCWLRSTFRPNNRAKDPNVSLFVVVVVMCSIQLWICVASRVCQRNRFILGKTYEKRGSLNFRDTSFAVEWWVKHRAVKYCV